VALAAAHSPNRIIASENACLVDLPVERLMPLRF